MSNKKHIDQEVQKTMESLDGIETAKTDDFFYSRVQAKLENRTTDSEQSGELAFAFSVAAVFLVLALNMILISQYRFSGTDSVTEREELIEELANQYQVFDLNYYETYETE